MARLQWDAISEKIYEAGVDRGVLYVGDGKGAYLDGVVWNGLINVTQSPTGAEPNPQYADNIKYLNVIGAEDFGASIEAFTYPNAFAICDGSAEVATGVTIGQQNRRSFGMAYRTLVGNDTEGTDYGYKIHIIYNAQAAPAEKSYATINETPDAITFNWEVTTTPVNVEDYKATALMTIDSTKASAESMAAIETILYGSDEEPARLPLPNEVIEIMGGPVVDPEA